jgi:hypothetical protein
MYLLPKNRLYCMLRGVMGTNRRWWCLPGRAAWCSRRKRRARSTNSGNARIWREEKAESERWRTERPTLLRGRGRPEESDPTPILEGIFCIWRGLGWVARLRVGSTCFRLLPLYAIWYYSKLEAMTKNLLPLYQQRLDNLTETVNYLHEIVGVDEALVLLND